MVSRRSGGLPLLNRRMAIQIGLMSLASSSWIKSGSAAPPAGDSFEPLNRFPRMMQEYLATRVQSAAELGRARKAAVYSRELAEEYVKYVRTLIGNCFGAFPERTPLNATVTGIEMRDQFQIEKVIFESRPQFFVTANLYLPTHRPGKCPGVVATCGHSANGKAYEGYQTFAQSLARLGYAVLIFDPIGQGERLQYPDEDLKSKVGVGVHEHLLAGNQQFLVGEFLGTWLAWDAMRALDYLLSRPEVDPQHVGITGNSGGGTLTTWMCGLEPRLTMAAPSCFVTTFLRNFQNELPADTEQCPPQALQFGLDHGDFLAAMAPKPVMIIAGEKDYFDVRGAIETYERLKPIYQLLGAEENLKLFIGPDPHGFTRPNREAMYAFFNAQTGVAEGGTEPTFVAETDATLQCTPKGQVSELGSRSVMSFTAEKSKHLRTTRGAVAAASLKTILADAIGPLLKISADYDILRSPRSRKYPAPYATVYSVKTERQVRAIVTRLTERPHLSRLENKPGRAILYISHHSCDAELRNEPMIRMLLSEEPDSEFFAVDVRGIGESRPGTCGENQFLEPYGSDYFYAIHSLMLGTPYPYQRAFDILRVIQWLTEHGRTEIHLAALKWGTVPATLAAVVSDHVKQVTLKGSMTSYSDVAESDHYDWPLSTLIPNVLSSFDLPDCYAALAEKQLRQWQINE